MEQTAEVVLSYKAPAFYRIRSLKIAGKVVQVEELGDWAIDMKPVDPYPTYPNVLDIKDYSSVKSYMSRAMVRTLDCDLGRFLISSLLIVPDRRVEGRLV